MVNPQTSTGSRQTSSRAGARGKKAVSSKRSAGVAGATVESDDAYGVVVSVLYHALQGAETMGQYIQAAEAAGNEQLVAFFEDCRTKQNGIALAGKRLLAEHLIELAEEEADDTDDE